MVLGFMQELESVSIDIHKEDVWMWKGESDVVYGEFFISYPYTTTYLATKI